MSTKAELTQKILNITMLIQDKFPELSKYLAELQETLPDMEHPHVEEQELQKYYQTLVTMTDDYLREHPEM